MFTKNVCASSSNMFNPIVSCNCNPWLLYRLCRGTTSTKPNLCYPFYYVCVCCICLIRCGGISHHILSKQKTQQYTIHLAIKAKFAQTMWICSFMTHMTISMGVASAAVRTEEQVEQVPTSREQLLFASIRQNLESSWCEGQLWKHFEQQRNQTLPPTRNMTYPRIFGSRGPKWRNPVLNQAFRRENWFWSVKGWKRHWHKQSGIIGTQSWPSTCAFSNNLPGPQMQTWHLSFWLKTNDSKLISIP